MLFHALVTSHLDYCLLFFFKISCLLLSLEKQMNWVLTSVFFLFKYQVILNELKIKQGYNQCTSLEYNHISDLLLPVPLMIRKKAFQNQLNLPTATYRSNSRTNQVLYMCNFSWVAVNRSNFSGRKDRGRTFWWNCRDRIECGRIWSKPSGRKRFLFASSRLTIIMWGICCVCTLALTVAKTSPHYDRFAISVPARSLLLFDLA